MGDHLIKIMRLFSEIDDMSSTLTNSSDHLSVYNLWVEATCFGAHTDCCYIYIYIYIQTRGNPCQMHYGYLLHLIHVSSHPIKRRI